MNALSPKRRFTEHKPLRPAAVAALPEDHDAVVQGRTLFPTAVVAAPDAPRLLVSGANQRKLGDRIVKGGWAGLPVYALTLEERATCPRTCHHWRDCYGDAMPFARRHRAGPDLEARLALELGEKQAQHPGGFAVRLHLLGDFYSVAYAEVWWGALLAIPGLHLFGFTAWQPDSEIGAAVATLNAEFPERCAIRLSATEPGPGRAVTINRVARGRIAEGVVCPAQTDDTECCGTCGLCWSPAFKVETVVFVRHGRKGRV